MYLRAQGLRESDAYRTLQLAPDAPHELIVEVYWALVSRRRQGDTHSGDLDAAYALLMDEHAREANAGAAVFRDARDFGNHYEALGVDPSADAGIIDAAYSFLTRNRQRIKRPRWQVIEEAYRIVANPKLRAQYDMSLIAVTRPSADDSPKASAGPPIAAKAPRKRGLFGRADRPPIADAVEQRLLGLRGAALASLPEPIATPPPEPLPTANAVAEMVFVAGPQAGLRIPLDGAAVSMGADPRHHVLLDGLSGHDGVHLWRHGDRFMLRQNGIGAVLVGGRKLDLPVMAMDDGDEIAFGTHRVRFRRIAPA